jgi:hypothetical protein
LAWWSPHGFDLGDRLDRRSLAATEANRLKNGIGRKE